MPSTVTRLPRLAGLSSVTWLLPERFSEGELSIEALHTALGLLSSFHDSIVSAAPGGPSSPGVDLALALSTLEQVQVCLVVCRCTLTFSLLSDKKHSRGDYC